MLIGRVEKKEDQRRRRLKKVEDATKRKNKNDGRGTAPPPKKKRTPRRPFSYSNGGSDGLSRNGPTAHRHGKSAELGFPLTASAAAARQQPQAPRRPRPQA